MAVATIVIPTYNRVTLLDRAVRSVLSQSRRDFRLCICDNASTDGTAEYVQELQGRDSRVEYFRHGQNLGLLGNWNFGLTQIDTDFFSILCDDDFLLPGFLAGALQEFATHPDAAYVAGTSIVAADDTTMKSVAPSAEVECGYFLPPDGFRAITSVPQHPATTAILFRRDVLDFYPQLDLETGPLGDLDLFLKVSLQLPIVLSPEVWGVYVHSSVSNAYNNLSANIWAGLPKMVANLEAIPLTEASHQEMRTRACNTYYSRVARMGVAASIHSAKRMNVRTAADELRFAVQLAQSRKRTAELVVAVVEERWTNTKRRASAVALRRWQTLFAPRAYYAAPPPGNAGATPLSPEDAFREEAEQHLAYMANL